MTKHWKSILVWYFAVTGVFLHLAVTGIWLMRPDLVWQVREKVTLGLSERGLLPASANTQEQEISWDQIRLGLPEWQPQPATILAPDAGTLRIGARSFTSITEAVAALQPGDTLDIGPGVYSTPMEIDDDNVTIVGHGRVVLEKGTAKGKGNLLIRGNGVQVQNLECRFITVPDRNGACIRLEGQDLFVDHVYFHDSEQGILTGSQPGFVHIRDSRFEQLGAGGQAHGIYIGGGKLLIEGSLFLAAKDQGHEIKSRARVTTIVRSVIASLSGKDSRLIDASNGGELTIEDCLLEQGPNTVNGDAIGFALEGKRHAEANDRLVLRNNLIILEREGQDRLLNVGNAAAELDIRNNVIIADDKTGYEDQNVLFKTRKDAGLPDYPMLPIQNVLAPESTVSTP